MGCLYDNVVKINTLYAAWKVVRQNALGSDSPSIRQEAEDFEANLPTNLRSLSSKLAARSFRFAPEKGILKRRAGKDPRPILLAPLRNRIVDRAILDTVSDSVLCPRIAGVLKAPHCIGGVRGVDAAIALIKEKLSKSGQWYVRSDIENFFTHIPRRRLDSILANSTDDAEFFDLFTQALDVQLSNPEHVQEYLRLFPDDQTGVPQGCALSMLAGNLILHEFDEQMNARGILCVRYVDDFILIARRKRHVQAAFTQARDHLQSLSLDAYPPDGSSSKAEIGQCDHGFVYLGCELAPGRIEPSKASCSSIVHRIDTLLDDGLKNVRRARDGKGGVRRDRRYYQTLVAVDRALDGWAKARSFCNRRGRFESVDQRVSERLGRFRRDVAGELRGADARSRRRALGISNAGETRYREPRYPERSVVSEI